MENKANRAKQQLESIRDVLKEFKDGISIDKLKTALDFVIAHRTLQRRLAELKESGEITSSGEGRATLYKIQSEREDRSTYAVQDGTSIVPLSPESKEILSLLSRPESVRRPVSYQREFLESYQPNKTSFLTLAEMKKLAEIGDNLSANKPAGTYAKEILQRLLIDLSWNSSRLEGNTYSLLETERLINAGEIADSKSVIEAQMILNHKEAIEFIVESADEIGFNRYTILNLHAMLSNDLLSDPAASGRLRSIAVGIQKSVYTPLRIPQQIEETFESILSIASQIRNPFEQSFFVMVHLPYLQPFVDVNKRVSRIAANIPLNAHNYAPLSFIDVPKDLYIQGLLGVYELNRVELLKDVFLWAYDRSAARYAALRQTIGEPDLFRLKYRAQMKAAITEVVSGALAQKEADIAIKKRAADYIPEADRAKFIEYAETELLSLHEGNFARYWIKPAEFEKWREVWEGQQL